MWVDLLEQSLDQVALLIVAHYWAAAALPGRAEMVAWGRTVANLIEHNAAVGLRSELPQAANDWRPARGDLTDGGDRAGRN